MTAEIQKLYDEAEKLFDDNNYSKIKEILSDEILEKYNSAELYTWRSRASKGDDKLNYAEKAISINNKYPNAYVAKGGYLVDNEHYFEAIKEYDTALTLDINNFVAYNNRGLAKYFLKNYEEAIKDFSESIKLRTDNIWRPYRNRSRAYQELATLERDNNDFEKALEYIKLAIQDIDESIKDKKTNKDGLESQKKNQKELRKLIIEAKNSQATIVQVNEMKEEVEKAKRQIEEQAKETQAALDNVQQLRDRMQDQANQFDMLSKNVKNVEDKFKNETIEIKALESFFAETLRKYEGVFENGKETVKGKVRKAESYVFWTNLVLISISSICVFIIGYVIYHDKDIIQDKAMMVYMISLTAIVLTPFVWMMKLAVNSRNQLFLLENEYRHKTALASSLYSFKLTLGDMYTKETTQQAFNTIYGQNPTDLLADDKSIRMKNKKEQEYPHVTLEIVQKVLPDIVDKCVKTVLEKKEEKNQ